MDLDILPPSDDRVFKLILTSPEAKPALMDLISALIKRPVTDVVVRNNELPAGDTQEKAERLDVNCRIDDGSQVDLEMQALSEISDKACNLIRNIIRADFIKSTIICYLLFVKGAVSFPPPSNLD